MKHKGIILLLLLTLLGACSVDESSNHELEGSEDKPAEATNETESTEGDSDNQDTEMEVPKTFSHSEYDYSIQLHDDFREKLVIDIGEITDIYYKDESLIKDNVLLGSIYPITVDDWESRDSFEVYGTYAYYSELDSRYYVYMPNIDSPYSELVDEYSEEIPEEYLDYLSTAGTLRNSLLKSNFAFGPMLDKQNIPIELNQNQIAGINISEQMYNDLTEWYTYLETNINDSMTLQEKGSIMYDLNSRVHETYPELRQIPFPTVEIGMNISMAMDLLRNWNEFPYPGEKANSIMIDNTIIIFEQFLVTISQQLDEIKNI